MALEENKAIVRRWVEVVWNQGNVDALDELVSDTYVRHDPNTPEVHGPEEQTQRVAMYRCAFPDLHFTIEDMVAEGEKVVGRLTARATAHKGELFGIPATDKQIMLTMTETYRLAEGKIDEQWVNMDALGMMEQLGALRYGGEILGPPPNQ